MVQVTRAERLARAKECLDSGRKATEDTQALLFLVESVAQSMVLVAEVMLGVKEDG